MDVAKADAERHALTRLDRVKHDQVGSWCCASLQFGHSSLHTHGESASLQ